MKKNIKCNAIVKNLKNTKYREIHVAIVKETESNRK